MLSIVIGDNDKKIDKLLSKLEKKNISEKLDPELFKIRELLREEKEKRDKEYIAMLCFAYLVENKKKLREPKQNENYLLVFALLGVVDKVLAQHVEAGLNKDKLINSYLLEKREPFKLVGTMHKFEVGEFEDINFSPIAAKSDDDPRLKNLKSIYKQLTSKETDPYYHKNSKEYKDMLDAIGEVVKYADVIDNMSGKKEILDEMLADVKESALKYLQANGSMPDSDLGKRRQELALAAVLAVDKEMGAKLIDSIIEDRKNMRMETGDLEKLKNLEDLSLESVIKNTNFDNTLSRDEKLDRLKKDITEKKKPVNDAALRTDTRVVHLAEYIARKIIYDKLDNMSEIKSKAFNPSNEEIKAGVDELLVSDTFLNTCKEFDLDKKSEPEQVIECDKFYDRLKENMRNNKEKTVDESEKSLSEQPDNVRINKHNSMKNK